MANAIGASKFNSSDLPAGAAESPAAIPFTKLDAAAAHSTGGLERPEEPRSSIYAGRQGRLKSEGSADWGWQLATQGFRKKRLPFYL